jgi:hypothetical protein
MRMPLRLEAHAVHVTRFFPRARAQGACGRLHLRGDAGGASLQLVDGEAAVFPFDGQPIAGNAAITTALFPRGNPREPIIVTITAGADGFQGELDLES